METILKFLNKNTDSLSAQRWKGIGLVCVNLRLFNLLYSTGNYAQYFIITYKGKESEIYMHTYIYTHTHIHKTELLCCTPETNTLYISILPLKKLTRFKNYK